MLINSTAPLYSDFFRLREKLLCDHVMKQKIVKINDRQSPYSMNSVRSNKINIETDFEKFERINKIMKKTESTYIKTEGNDDNTAPNRNVTKLPFIKAEGDEDTNKKNRSLAEVLIESKRVIDRIKKDQIKNENENFAKRLIRLKSPLSRDKMNQSFKRSREYLKITNKSINIKELRRKVLKSLHLPKIITSENSKK